MCGCDSHGRGGQSRHSVTAPDVRTSSLGTDRGALPPLRFSVLQLRLKITTSPGTSQMSLKGFCLKNGGLKEC